MMIIIACDKSSDKSQLQFSWPIHATFALVIINIMLLCCIKFIYRPIVMEVCSPMCTDASVGR